MRTEKLEIEGPTMEDPFKSKAKAEIKISMFFSEDRLPKEVTSGPIYNKKAYLNPVTNDIILRILRKEMGMQSKHILEDMRKLIQDPAKDMNFFEWLPLSTKLLEMIDLLEDHNKDR